MRGDLRLDSPAAAATTPANGADAGQGDFRVIAHRGASGYLPEHTLAAYALAIQQGADFIEPDLVSTRDGVLVARHENELSGTTDVARHRRFADRHTTKVIDGVAITGWFTEDFMLAELTTLRATERIPDVRPLNAVCNGQFQIATLEEVVALARSSRARDGKAVGIYPEIKHPSYLGSIGLSMEAELVRVLHASGYRGPRAPVFVQSFEVSSLRILATLTKLPLVQLVDSNGRPADFTASRDPRTYADLVAPEGLAFVATYADGIGACKDVLIPREADGTLGQPSAVIAKLTSPGSSSTDGPSGVRTGSCRSNTAGAATPMGRVTWSARSPPSWRQGWTASSPTTRTSGSRLSRIGQQWAGSMGRRSAVVQRRRWPQRRNRRLPALHARLVLERHVDLGPRREGWEWRLGVFALCVSLGVRHLPLVRPSDVPAPPRRLHGPTVVALANVGDSFGGR